MATPNAGPTDAVHLLLGALGMAAVGVGAVLLWWRRRPGLLAPAALGFAAWVAGVALKVAWAVPTNKPILAWFAGVLPAWAAKPVGHVYIGLLTGVFECGLVLLVVRRTRLRDAGYDAAVAFGLGKGGGEAVVLAAVTAVAGLFVWLGGSWLPADVQGVLHAAAEAAALRPLERLVALAGHAFSSVLIVYAVRRGQWRWFWASFVYLSAVDAFAAWAMDAYGKQQLMLQPGFWLGLAPFAVLGAVGVWLLRRPFAAL